MRSSLLIFGVFVLAASSASADQVHLTQGQVLEGNATVEGDKVVIEMESGRVTVERSEVARIDKAVTPLAEANAREAKLKANDTAGMLALANFCRDHDLYNKEHELLTRVIGVEPDHAEARRRLGYVRQTVNGHEAWVEKAQVVHKEDEAQRLAHRQAQLAIAEREAELAATQNKLKLDRERADREQEQRDKQNDIYAIRPYSSYGPYGAYGYGYGGYGYGYGYGGNHLSKPNFGSNYIINGVHNPGDPAGANYALPGVRPAASYYGGQFHGHRR